LAIAQKTWMKSYGIKNHSIKIMELDREKNMDEHSISMMIGNEAKKRSYADIIKRSIKKEECKPLNEDIHE
jgi:hypothetical protein